MISNRFALSVSLLTSVTLAGSVDSAAGDVSAPVSTTVLDLQLSELRGATLAEDDSGFGNDGAIGSRVIMTGGYATFPFVRPNSVSYGLDQLITIPDSASLDPERAPFTVAMRYRTTHGFGNILQKGQATDPGGQVKLQQPKGKLTCMFKTSVGTATAGSGTKPLDDGLWHDISCVRTTSSVTMYVDGVRTGRSTHTTGDLDNSQPWTLGGKPKCDGTKVTCDYYAGDIDSVTLTKGIALPPDPVG